MYIRTATIKNMRCFGKLEWKLPTDVKANGWHVIIGDNGSGKTSFLRCLALALCGPRSEALHQDWKAWVKVGTLKSEVSSTLIHFEFSPKWDVESEQDSLLNHPYGVTIRKDDEDEKLLVSGVVGAGFTRQMQGPRGLVPAWFKIKNPGFFSAAYGPFRRFLGGIKDYKGMADTHYALIRHLSVFGEEIALPEALEWLGQLRFEELEGDKKSADLISHLINFINQPDFLPHGVRFHEVTSKGAVFLTPDGIPIDVTRLSDGYRSILSMTFDLIRNIFLCYETSEIFEVDADGKITICTPGVVLIDEVDAHLHPTWQRTIGLWFTKHFPEMQFIVTTHSPLVCQAAENGTIFRLPSPGADQDESDYGFVTGVSRNRLIYGDVLDAYGTGVFGRDVDRSDIAQEKLAELARLNQKLVRTKGLTEEEQAKRQELQQTFAAHAPRSF